VSVDDVELDYDTADRLIALADPALRTASVERLTGGANSSVFHVATTSGRDLVLKAYSDAFRWKLEKEVYVYDLVRRHGVDAPVPEILATDDSKALFSYNFALMTKCEGRNVLSLLDELSNLDLEAVNRQIGAILRRLHDVTFDEFGYVGVSGVVEPHATNTAYMTFQFEKKLGEFDRLGGDAELRQHTERYVTERSELLVACPRASLCHDDCHEGNVLVLPRDGSWRVSALLDFENVVAGDPLLDLAKAHCYSRRPSEDNLNALVEGYGELRDGWRETIDLYVVYHLLELWDWFAFIDVSEPLPGIAGQLRQLCDPVA
jgi:aminoglycoside phosphotransferase (APT) family kinase protein